MPIRKMNLPTEELFMRFFFPVLVSSIALGACGLDPSLISEPEANEKNASSATPQTGEAQNSATEETGSLSFDLTGIQVDSETQDPSLALTSPPLPSPDRFEFLLTGSKEGVQWVRKETFQASQKTASIGLLPAGTIKVQLRVVNSEGVTSKTAEGEAKILPKQVTTLVLTLQTNTGKEDSGTLIIKVVDNDQGDNLCKQNVFYMVGCALPSDPAPLNKICSVTIAGKSYSANAGICVVKANFGRYLCDQGVKVTQSDLDRVICKDEVQVCPQIAGHLYSRQDASAVPFTNGCQREELLKSGKAAFLDEIPALFSKGEVCTQVSSQWSHPLSKETVRAANGCQAAGLKLLGFTPIPQALIK
jgi:hypothetical protein